ncbi:MAG: alpha/beta hydrolase-fold protein [Candidatus Kryptonium sp.]|nr:alpha/beta hydrolase-fold protein [Candidatus Kryptonium sp.]MCX7762984.1 alpha/beta hydrolase-fold protein [Candidatus Kryptonium sp.]MDW8108585.1 alpha/beta hydrolase-fold protein [Candidatus Kryptonium sp.]
MRILLTALIFLFVWGCGGNTNQKVNNKHSTERIELSGKWLFRIGDNKEWSDVKIDEFGWVEIQVPSQWEKQGYNFDGVAWYRKHVKIPSSFKDKKIYLYLGKIDDNDKVYFNGELIGITRGWTQERFYFIPNDLIKYDEDNVIAIRVEDLGFGGGIYEGPILIVSRDELWRMRGENKKMAKPDEYNAVFLTVKIMDTLLTTGKFASYLAFISPTFREDEKVYTIWKREMGQISNFLTENRYSIGYVDFKVYHSPENDSILVADYVRLIKDTLGLVKFSDEQVRYFKIENGALIEIGNRSRFFRTKFYSRWLQEERNLYVYLPPSYDIDLGKRYPVLYLLHGYGGSDESWKYDNINLIVDSLINIGKIVEMIIIMPDADTSFYVNSKDKKRMYEQYIVEDLINYVDATFRTIPYRETRAIDGVSMGGGGAMRIGLKYFDKFISIGSMMGALDVPFERVKNRTYIHAGDSIYWRSIQPTSIAQELTKQHFDSLYIFFYVGDKDWLKDGNLKMHEILKSKGARHEFKIYPGEHNRDFWFSHFTENLIFHSNNFYKSKYVKIKERLKTQ